MIHPRAFPRTRIATADPANDPGFVSSVRARLDEAVRGDRVGAGVRDFPRMSSAFALTAADLLELLSMS